MISAIGIRNVVENQVDFTKSRNTIIAALILVCALGFNSVGGASFTIKGVTITLSGLAIAAIRWYPSKCNFARQRLRVR